MNYRHISKMLFFSFVLLINPLFAQASGIEHRVSGFSNYIAGATTDYQSCHPEATEGMLVRCLNKDAYMEWETDSVAGANVNDIVKFTWIGGYAVGSAKSRHIFKFDAGENIHFEISLVQLADKKEWALEEKNTRLEFRTEKVDRNNDYFGYFSLTLPVKEIPTTGRLKIKITGDGSNSRDWFMTMQYPLIPKIRISPEKIISKDADGKLSQQVRVSIDDFDTPKAVKIVTEGHEAVSSMLSLGANDYTLKYEVTNSPVEKSIEINIDGKVTSHPVTISPVKEMTFYLIPEAHVDIGYTALQHECEKRHWKNFDLAMEYSKRSADYPVESVFKWNTEALWAVKSYLEEFPEKREQFIGAVKKGWMNLDANYANVLTGLCRPEELYKLVGYSNVIEKETGVKIQSAIISDVPGYTWGIVQAYADNGIKYFSVGPNEFDRIGNTLSTWGDKPFYWKSPSGEKKILVWVAGKGYSWFHHWQITRDDITPLLNYMDELEAENYPYDMVHVRYNIGGDNGYPDSLLSDFVKSWNQTHETPKFVLSSTMKMFEDFEAKYGSKIPEYSGDFTPYWEDGAGSTAKETALNRNTAEFLTQLENLYSLKSIKDFPQKEFDEAWKNVLLYSEHTWGAWNSISDPNNQLVKDQWAVKQSFALKADSIAQKLYTALAFDKNNNQNITDKVNVFNTSSWKRTDLVTIPSKVKTVGDLVIDENGKQIKSQRLTTGELVFVAIDVPALGCKQYSFTQGEIKQKDAVSKSEDNMNTTISNKFFSIAVNKETGAIDKITSGKSKFNFSDETNMYGLNGYIYTGTNAENPRTNGKVDITMKESGPVLSSLFVKSDAPGCNSLTREVELYSDLKKIGISNTIDKKNVFEKENVRFAFPFRIQNPETRLDIAWAVIRPEKDQLAGADKNYFTVQRWADVSNSSVGATLAIIDAPLLEVGGMYGEAWMKPQKQDWFTKTSSSSLLYSWVMNNSWGTNYRASQEGSVSFRYAILPHAGFDYLQSYKFGVEQSQPFILMYNAQNMKIESPLFRLDENSKIVLTLLEPSRDKKNLMIRLYNPTNVAAETNITWNGKAKHKLYLSNGDEDNISETTDKVELKPFEVKTSKVVF